MQVNDGGDSEPEVHVIAMAEDTVYPELHAGAQVRVEASDAPAPHDALLGTVGRVHTMAHVKVAGVSTVAVHESIGVVVANPEVQDGAHDDPDVMVVPIPHIAPLVTVGSVQGLGLHVNDAGVNVPAEHDSDESDAVYIAVHDGAHVVPDVCVPPIPHIMLLVTVGSMQGLGLHVNVVGDSVPEVHTRFVAAEMVYPALHDGAHDEPEAMLPVLQVALLGTAVNVHTMRHEKVEGDRVPVMQASDAVVVENPTMHPGVHEFPDTIVPPAPHDVADATVGSVQGLGLQVNVAGDSAAAVQVIVMVAVKYPGTQLGEHVPPEATLAPVPHIAPFVTIG